MFIDSSLEIADNTDVKLNNGVTAKLGNEIDLRGDKAILDNATVDLSAGEKMFLVIEVTASFVGSGASYKFNLTTSTESALTGGTTKDIWTSGNQGVAELVKGKRYIANLPEAEYHRFLGLRGTATGANVTTANINAFLTKDVTNWQGSATRVPATDPAN